MKTILKNMNIRDLSLSRLSRRIQIILSAVLLFAVCCVLFAIYLSPPSNFPVNTVINIEKGASFKEVAADFQNKQLLRSGFLFEVLGWIFRKEKDVRAGEYFFEKPLCAYELLKNITGNDYKKELVKVTIPEGATIKDIEKIFENLGFENFKIENKELEGYLFPDTYFVPIDISSEAMVEIMLDNFDKKTTPEMKVKEIIIMASLIEKEVATEKDRGLVSGVLWKRLEAGMLLQVDAVFPYIIGKNTFQLTKEDLKIDSPYNTYLYKGLPPGPIANPGLDSINASLRPAESPYWYYLSDKEGNTYYSVTYDEHLIKKAKYLQ